MINVSIIDDHPIVVQGLEKMLSGHPKIYLQSTYRDADDLMKGLSKQQPDVLLLDLQLPDSTGEEVAKLVKEHYPVVRILVLTNMDQVFTVRTLFAAGVIGYLLKGTDKYTLIEAIESVFDGKQYLDPILKEGVLQNLLGPSEEQAFLLTTREQLVLEMIAAEMTTKEIAQKLFISDKRVESCRTDLFIKLAVKNVAGLVRKGIQLGLIK